eukprot:TRINITY_DN1211_c0_g3_i1.p1 TRINITY_DN1211_c0_g3~~TRINITY_DN1211_c0_g3_i1.p1  ORF type:complete len:458 (-),score=37.04 TRINITY_DN1211_c0_g3_i1:35-1408(-)
MIFQSYKLPIIFCVYSFLSTFNPSSPFLALYLVQLGISQEQVYSSVYPIWTYSYFGCLLILGLIGEYIGYKVSIVFGTIGYVISSVMLVTTSDLLLIQLQEVAYAFNSAAYIIFTSYIYCVERESYQTVTSLVRFSYLVGTVTSALLGQALLWTPFSKDASSTGIGMIVLFYIGLGFSCAAVLWAFSTFPSKVQHSSISSQHLIQPNANTDIETDTSTSTNTQANKSFYTSLRGLLRDMINAYKNPTVLAWSIWWGISLGIHHLALTFWQVLIIAVDSKGASHWTGYISSVTYLLAACSAMIPIKMEKFLSRHLSVLFVVVSWVLGGSLVAFGLSPTIWFATIFFILYSCQFEFMVPIVSVQVAANMKARVGLVFSVNTMLVMITQIIVQFIIGKQALNLTIRNQFICMGGILIVLGFIYLILGVCGITRKGVNNYDQGREYTIVESQVNEKESSVQ